MAHLVGGGAQAELGVARRGQLHQPGLGRLDDRGEVAAHGRLQVRDGAARPLEDQARHARQERLAAGKAPHVDGQVDVLAGLAVEDGVPQLVREGPRRPSARGTSGAASSMSARCSGRWNHWASIASWPAMMSWLSAPGFGQALAHGQRVAGPRTAMSGTAAHMVRL